MEDEEIRAALRRGNNDEAFRLLAKAHAGAAYDRCVWITGNPKTAEDAMQEAMITVFRNRAKLLEVSSMRGWLITIAMRKALDAVRSLKRVGRLHDAASERAPSRDEQDVIARLAATEDQRALEGCLAALDPEVRAAILMRYRDDLSWEEIAEATGVTLDTIRMRVQRRALKSLRLCLEAKTVKP